MFCYVNKQFILASLYQIFEVLAFLDHINPSLFLLPLEKIEIELCHFFIITEAYCQSYMIHVKSSKENFERLYWKKGCNDPPFLANL